MAFNFRFNKFGLNETQVPQISEISNMLYISYTFKLGVTGIMVIFKYGGQLLLYQVYWIHLHFTCISNYPFNNISDNEV